LTIYKLRDVIGHVTFDSP